MRLTVKERKKAAAIVATRYQKSRKTDKGLILNEFTELTGYGRRYASYVLRSHGKKVWSNEATIMQSDIRKRTPRKRTHIYDGEVLEALRRFGTLWTTFAAKGLLLCLGRP